MTRRCAVLLLAATALVADPAHAGCPDFGTAANYPVGSAPPSVAVGDFNGDGKLDLASANVGSSTVSILLNNGNGTFAPAVSYTTNTNPNFPTGPNFIAVGDFNRDGKLDLATADYSLGTVSILIGNGDGTFGAPG